MSRIVMKSTDLSKKKKIVQKWFKVVAPAKAWPNLAKNDFFPKNQANSIQF